MASLQNSNRWRILEPHTAEEANLTETLGVSKLVAKVLSARGFSAPEKTQAYLAATLETAWKDPSEIPHMDEAARRLVRAVQEQENIVVFGDYDVDGISATTLLVEALRGFGAKRVIPFIPYRQGEGYGMSEAAIARLLSEGVPDLLVTVDNGIANAQEVSSLRAKGIDVVITDHHVAGDQVPKDVCVVDPKYEGDGYSQFLSGAGVALKLVEKMGEFLGEGQRWKDFTDLATLGTIADCMDLTAENRALVKDGISQIRSTTRPGLVALAEAVGTDLSETHAQELSFSLIPHLNAAGRMNDPEVALKLLLSKDPLQATELAHELVVLNSARKKMEAEESKAAIAQATLQPEDEEAVVVWGTQYHDGIKGIVASRVMNRFQKPALVFSVDEEGVATGSGRSFGKLDLFQAIQNTSDCLERFGGHSQAVGVTLLEKDLPVFHARLNQEIARQQKEEQDTRKDIVAALSITDLTPGQVESLDVLKPYGAGNSAPLFCLCDMDVLDVRRIGFDKNHLSFFVSDGQYALPCVYFSPASIALLDHYYGVVDVVFEPQIDTWRGEKRVKLYIKDILKQNDLQEPEDVETAELVENLFSRAPEMLSQDEYASIGQASSFFTKVVGVSFDARQEVARTLQAGDTLLLARDPQNEFDPFAIKVENNSGQQLGFLRKEIAKHVAPQMDEGRDYVACVQEVTGKQGEGQSLGVNIEVTRKPTLEEELHSTPMREKPALTAREALNLTAELKTRFIGEHALLEAQERALGFLGKKQNVLCVMATGRGKSLIFHIHAAKVAILERKASVFVFPLRALVNDQAFHLEAVFNELGIKVARLTGESTAPEREEVLAGLQDGSIQVILTTPEYLAIHTADFAKSERVGFVVFDESHHAGESKGGNRSSYQQMPLVLEELGQPTVLAVTATANDDAAQEIVRLFQINEVIKDESIRENLHIHDARGASGREAIVKNKVATGDKCVIYVNSRDQSIALARNLRKALPHLGHKIAFYNAALTREERKAVEEAFRAGRLSAIVSTSAFGEGVNIGDIRHVFLYHMPFGHVEFNQMSGRAGRDGKDAFIHLLFGPKDAFINEHILDAMAPTKEELVSLYKTLLVLQKEQGEGPDFSFALENEAIAERVVTLFPGTKFDEKAVSSGIAIFKELGFLETHGFSRARRIIMTKQPEKKDLSLSSRFVEGERTSLAFSSFKDWVLHADEAELLAHINRPITPSFGTSVS